MAETTMSSHIKSEHSTRKNKKPLMEKRRRARINSCLSQLKSLVLQAIKKDSSQFSKLEKADILELTVKHLRALQRQQVAGAMAQDPQVVTKYRAGFNECAKEVVRYMGSVREVNDDVRDRVLGHLAGCLQVVNQVSPSDGLQQVPPPASRPQPVQPQQLQQLQPLHVHIPGQPQLSAHVAVAGVAPSVLMQQMPQGHQVVPNGLGYAPSHLRTSASPDSVVSQRQTTPSSSSSSSMSVNATPLSSLPMQTAASAQHAAQTHISGAFKIVPSSAGAVALYLPASHPQGVPASSRVDAVPVYSVALPPQSSSELPPPPRSSTPVSPSPSLSSISSASSSYSTSPLRVSASPASSSSSSLHLDARLGSASPDFHYPHHAHLAQQALPVDLRQSHKVRASVEAARHPLSFGQYSPSAMQDEKVWRPW